jgi:hypothetical protein
VTAVALITCFSLRVMAIKYGWRLPVAKFRNQDISDVAKEESKNAERS